MEMNIPLNIDWQQILLHLFNFSILGLGMYLLLYKPVKGFMDQRTEHYRQMEQQAQEKLTQAGELEVSYQERLNNVEAEIGEKRAKASQESEQKADELLQDAKEQAARMLADAQNAARQERAKILEDTQQEIASLAMAAAEKLLAPSASGALDQFLDAAKKG